MVSALVRSVGVFQPTRPLRGATWRPDLILCDDLEFQPTRPLRGATARPQGLPRAACISTHAPLAGRDLPREGSFAATNRFQPTRPLRGATVIYTEDQLVKVFQPTRPLRGATRGQRNHRLFQGISTHAPLAGRDGDIIAQTERTFEFQPTRPLRGATATPEAMFETEVTFQPTRPLRGATSPTSRTTPRRLYFNPRAPCGARPLFAAPPPQAQNFNPRAPCGARRKSLRSGSRSSNFNPRAPCGARQQKCTNHYAHFCDNRQISDAFAQNAACQGILLLFDAGKSCGFWVRTAQVISAHLCFAL